MFWTKRHTDTLTGKMIEVNFACGIDARDEQLLRVPFTHFTSTPNQICAKITLKLMLAGSIENKAYQASMAHKNWLIGRCAGGPGLPWVLVVFGTQ